MPMSRTARFILPVLVALTVAAPALAAGAEATTETGPGAKPQAAEPAVQLTGGWLLHLPGIAGDTQIDRGLVPGLRDGGVECERRLYECTGDASGIPALVNRKRHQEEATKVAQISTERRRQHPNSRIGLTAHSGGTGIAVWALEM